MPLYYPNNATAKVAVVSGTNRWIGSAEEATGLTTVVGLADTVELMPFVVPRAMSVLSLGVLVAALVAAAQGKVVAYASNALGQPDKLLAETAALDFSTTGFKSAAVAAFALAAGQLIWLGIRHSSTATINAHATYTTPTIDEGITPTANPLKVLRRTLAFATPAPANWGFVAAEATFSAAPALFMRET